MIRSSKLFRPGIAVVALGILGATAGTAQSEENFFDTGDVKVEAQTRAVNVGVGSFNVSVDKVSNPVVRVWVRDSNNLPDVTTTTYGAGENNCAAKNDIMAGTLNRVVNVKLSPGSTTVYLKVQYTQTTAVGLSHTTVLEPFGPTGTTLSPLLYASGELPPISICVS